MSRKTGKANEVDAIVVSVWFAINKLELLISKETDTYLKSAFQRAIQHMQMAQMTLENELRSNRL